MNFRLLKLTAALPLSIFVLGLPVSTNLSANESDRVIKLERKHSKQKQHKAHKRRHHRHHDNSSSRRHHSHGDRHRPRHNPRHHYGRYGDDWWGYKGDYRPRRYRPRSGFTYYSDDYYGDDDRLDFIIRYRWYD